MHMRALICAAALAAGMAQALAADPPTLPDPAKLSEKPAIALPVRGVSCATEAGRRKLVEPARTAYVNECRKVRIGLRNQRRLACNAEAAEHKHLYGLAKHRFVDLCMLRRAAAQTPADKDDKAGLPREQPAAAK